MILLSYLLSIDKHLSNLNLRGGLVLYCITKPVVRTETAIGFPVSPPPKKVCICRVPRIVSDTRKAIQIYSLTLNP